MATGTFTTTILGWVAIVTGISAVLAVLFLILMFALNPSFGKVNDVFNSLLGVSSMVLAWMVYPDFHAKSPLLSQIALVLAVVGAIFTIIGSILIIFGFTDFVLAGWYSGLGNAMIGLWLVGFCYALLRAGSLPQSLLVLGIVTGAFMAVGLVGIPGIFARVDSMESMPRVLYIAFMSWLGTYFLYPIWTIWLGRFLLLK